jgi:hypothetical protein
MKLVYYTPKQINTLIDSIDKQHGAYASLEQLNIYLKHLSIIPNTEQAYELPDAPSLEPDLRKDAENAVKLHKWIMAASPKIPRTVLADSRLWAALCHVTFAPYLIERWGADEEGESPTSRIRARFFASGEGQRALVRNGLARLFFAADLLFQDGDYSLVPALFVKQDIHQGFLERAIGGDAGLLKEIVKNIAQIPDDQLAKKQIQTFAKLINGAAGIRTIDEVKNNGLASIVKISFH